MFVPTADNSAITMVVVETVQFLIASVAAKAFGLMMVVEDIQFILMMRNQFQQARLKVNKNSQRENF